MKVVIVTGCRGFRKTEIVAAALRLENPDLVVHGGCRGVDMCAEQWCGANAVPVCKVPADWNKYGNSAGPRRNKKMLSMFPDAVVLAFPSKNSRGTRHCIAAAEDMGMTVKVIEV